jgi:hypothetical protein
MILFSNHLCFFAKKLLEIANYSGHLMMTFSCLKVLISLDLLPLLSELGLTGLRDFRIILVLYATRSFSNEPGCWQYIPK